MPAPLQAFQGARVMTLLEGVRSETLRERSIPVLETKRLVVRAPHLEDVKAIAEIANDRRIAENTADIPSPYTVADAERFVTKVCRGEDEAAYLVTLRDRSIIGAVCFARS